MECSNTHRFGIVADSHLNYHSVVFAAKDYANGRILVRFANSAVEGRKIETQLTKMRGLESGVFQFHGHQGIELAIEEQQVDELFFLTDHHPELFTDEHEILPKTKDEVANISHYLFVEDSLVAVFHICIEVFGIDEVKQILFLESLHGADCELLVWNSLSKIVGKITAFVIEIVLQVVTQHVFVPAMHGTLMDIECPSFEGLFFAENHHMMSERNPHELRPVEFVGQWLTNFTE